MGLFSRLLTSSERPKAEVVQQPGTKAEIERLRLIELGHQVLTAMETEYRLAGYVERYRNSSYQDQTLLTEWHESRAKVERLFDEYATAFGPYRAAALRANPAITGHCETPSPRGRTPLPQLRPT